MAKISERRCADSSLRKRDHSGAMSMDYTRSKKHSHYLLFALGAATGSALGLVVGSLLTYWLGEDTLEAMSSTLRRLTGQGNKPNFELFLQ